MTVPVPRTRREAVARLSIAQKSNRGAAGYSRWINRPLGRQLAAFAFLRELTPNQVSAISAVFTFGSIGALTLLRPTWTLAIAVPVGLLIGYAFDSADGQLARLRGGGSPAGEWLDHVLDAVKCSSIHLAIAIMWFRFYHLQHAQFLLIPLGFSAIQTVFFFAITLSDMLRRVVRASAGATSVTTASVDPGEVAPVLRSLFVLPNDYGVLCLSMLTIAMHVVFGVIYAVLLAANTLFLLAGCVRWFREMDALGRIGS